jgi:hypothetical protein
MNFKQRLDRFLTKSDDDYSSEDDNILQVESLEFANSFDYDENGLITNPGKFERECRYVPYFWNLTMHSAQDDTEYDEFMGFYVFNITEDDLKIFPELKNTESVTVYECSQGFVYSLLEEAD